MSRRAVWWLWPAMVVFSLAAQQPEPVRLGLLVPVGEMGVAVRHGAEIALDAANRDGGYLGRPFELVVREVEGLWGSSTSKITSLAFDESVRAILGPIDGRAAHLAEQVAAKAHVALVSPWASDPTLTQANVPWFFRCVPDDRRQAAALAREIFEVRGLDRVVAIVADSYDARAAADAFAAQASAPTAPDAVGGVDAGGGAGARKAADAYTDRWPAPETGVDLDAILGRLERERIEGVVLFGPPLEAGALMRGLRARGPRIPVFAPLSGADLAPVDAASFHQGELFVIAPGHWLTPEGRAFQRAFVDAFGHPPPAVSAYAHDGMLVIVEAVRRAGLDRQRIRDAVAEVDHQRGATGRVRFDERGNRVTEVELRDISRR